MNYQYSEVDMPLDSKQLKASTLELFKEIPYDRDGVRKHEFVYQTKIEMYDKFCGACGFNRIIVHADGKDVTFRSIEEAISFAQATGGSMTRSCEYPSDLEEQNGEVIYPTLNEIIINGCRFWHNDKIEADEDQDEYGQ